MTNKILRLFGFPGGLGPRDTRADMINRAKDLYNDHDHGNRREKNLLSFKSQCDDMDLDWRLIAWRARMSIKVDQVYGRSKPAKKYISSSSSHIEKIEAHKRFVEAYVTQKVSICEASEYLDDRSRMCPELCCSKCVFKDRLDSKGFKILDQKYTREEWIKELETLIKETGGM